MFLHLAGKLFYSQVTLQLSMAMRRDVRDFLDLARGIDLIDDIDHQLLYNVNRANRPNLEIPYWQYQRFDLERLTDDECRVEFRFKKNDIYDIVNVLQIPNIVTYNRLTVEPVEGLCILLKRLAYPCRYSDMVPRFARPIPELCIITNHVMNLIRYLQISNFRETIVLPLTVLPVVTKLHRIVRFLRNCSSATRWCPILVSCPDWRERH